MRRAMRSRGSIIFVVLFSLAAAPTTAPTSKPVDDASMDWLMSQSTTAPTSAPTESILDDPNVPSTQKSPLVSKSKGNAEGRGGLIEMSDGTLFRATLSTTQGKPIRVFDPDKSDYRDIPFAIIKKAEASILWERDEEEWHFKASGSDIKEYSGKTYPARETTYTFTLANGQKVSGSVVAPIYAESTDGSTRTFVLYKRSKGEVGQTLKQLAYVKKIEFDQ